MPRHVHITVSAHRLSPFYELRDIDYIKSPWSGVIGHLFDLSGCSINDDPHISATMISKAVNSPVSIVPINMDRFNPRKAFPSCCPISYFRRF